MYDRYLCVGTIGAWRLLHGLWYAIRHQRYMPIKRHISLLPEARKMASFWQAGFLFTSSWGTVAFIRAPEILQIQLELSLDSSQWACLLQEGMGYTWDLAALMSYMLKSSSGLSRIVVIFYFKLLESVSKVIAWFFFLSPFVPNLSTIGLRLYSSSKCSL